MLHADFGSTLKQSTVLGEEGSMAKQKVRFFPPLLVMVRLGMTRSILPGGTDAEYLFVAASKFTATLFSLLLSDESKGILHRCCAMAAIGKLSMRKDVAREENCIVGESV